MTWADVLVDFAASNIGPEAREALWSRGVSDAQIRDFRIGYVDRDLPADVSKHFLEWAQGGSKLDDVFVLPLTNTLGAIKGFQFRHVDQERSGYMDYFLDRREAALFGLSQAAPFMWTTRSVYLVEGAFDLFPVQRVFPAVVATLTAGTSALMLRVLRRLVQNVWLGYDMDATGRRGCVEFKDQHEHEFQVYVVVYPPVRGIRGGIVKDAGELWEAWGDDQMAPFIRQTVQVDPFQ